MQVVAVAAAVAVAVRTIAAANQTVDNGVTKVVSSQ